MRGRQSGQVSMMLLDIAELIPSKHLLWENQSDSLICTSHGVYTEFGINQRPLLPLTSHGQDFVRDPTSL